jgi:hypothetical protein
MDEQEFEILIYHNGVEIDAPVRGRGRYLDEKKFLNELTGVTYPPESMPRPIPDPTQDFYMLNDEQFEAYLAFRETLGGRDY